MSSVAHHSVAVVGGGQAGLSISHLLSRRGIDHVVFEKHRAMHAWSTARWDSFCLVTPNWQCQLPDHPYDGNDPDGFMVRDEIIAYLSAFRAKVNPPIREGVAVTRVIALPRGGFGIHTSAGDFSADQVVVATGAYQDPIVPEFAARLPPGITQLHSEQYRSADALPAGEVLVVGSGQSGAQIAEDLHLAGRKVHLAVGSAPRCARFYRGRDVVTWLAEMGYYDIAVEEHPLREGVRDKTNHYVTGRDGGRDIDLRKFALEGMQLYGRLAGLDQGVLRFHEDLRANLDDADGVYNRINASIDDYIAKRGIGAPPGRAYVPVWQPPAERPTLDPLAAGITSVIWCIGLRPNYRWLEVPVLDGFGQPVHVRGVSPHPGLYFLGLPWLHTWGSGRFSGVGRDAEYLVGRIAGGVPGIAARARSSIPA
jgi:putative flavoprotein involved in K+ transport